jgi:uncharacterized membrane protein
LQKNEQLLLVISYIDEMLKKTHALFCYCTVIGWMVAYVIYCNQKEKDPFVQFHLRQSFGVGLFSLVCMAVLWIGGFNMFEYSLPSLVTVIMLLSIWIYCFNIAMQEKVQLLPLLGRQFQRWFRYL